MKVYFSASRSQRGEFGAVYDDVINVLGDAGYVVEDNGRLRSASGSYLGLSRQEKTNLYREMVKNVEKSDLCVFEASFPSTLHIGHEITVAQSKGKPVVVLYGEGKEPIMFHGIPDNRIIWVEYNEKNLKDNLMTAVSKAVKNVDVRLNFFLPNSLLARLDAAAGKKGMNRSEFIRELIEKDKRKAK